jgi:thiol-disulfide isomerase/thioredoxin
VKRNVSTTRTDTQVYEESAAVAVRDQESAHPPLRASAMNLRSNALLAVVAIAATAALVTLAAPSASGGPAAAHPVAAPDFQGIATWQNSPPLTMEALRGKVVLVDFWTYTCSNCLNQLPHVKEWHDRFKDQGLVVIGVHTPEYAFEKSTPNVQEAIRKLRITHAVAQDNDYATWRAYGNQYWPALYLIDKQGRIVYTHFGEGRYGETEGRIKALLAESSAPAAAPAR